MHRTRARGAELRMLLLGQLGTQRAVVPHREHRKGQSAFLLVRTQGQPLRPAGAARSRRQPCVMRSSGTLRSENVTWAPKTRAACTGGASGCPWIVTRSLRRARISPEVQHFMHEFWEFAAFVANVIIFIVVGVVIALMLGSFIEAAFVMAVVPFALLGVVLIFVLHGQDLSLFALIGTVGLAALLHAIGSTTNPMFGVNPMWHLLLGGFAFGAVFMATDPVSATMTNGGKWAYGLLIGIMTTLIRVVNPAFPEGVMLAILFGNVFAPVLDHFVVQANIKRRMLRTAV